MPGVADCTVLSLLSSPNKIALEFDISDAEHSENYVHQNELAKAQNQSLFTQISLLKIFSILYIPNM